MRSRKAASGIRRAAAVPSFAGEINTRKVEDFKMAASFFALTPEHLGQTFRDEHGLRFRLVGLNIRSRKRPFIIADVTGK